MRRSPARACGAVAVLVAFAALPCVAGAQTTAPSPSTPELPVLNSPLPDPAARPWESSGGEITGAWLSDGIGPVVGYDRGFFLQDRPGDAGRYRIQLNAWGQFRVAFPDFENPTEPFATAGVPDSVDAVDGLTFEAERTRVILSGFAIDPALTYYLQFDGDSDGKNQVDLLDAFADFDLGRALFDWEPKRLQFRAGRSKVPFSRARALSGRRLAFADRSVASLFFDSGRAVGVGLGGTAKPLGRPAAWQTAIVNGLDTGSLAPGTGELDGNPAVSGRWQFDPIGDWGTDAVSDLAYHERLAVRIGGGAAFSPIDAVGASEFDRPAVVDSGLPLADVLPASATGYDETLVSLDASLRYRGLSLFAEWYGRRISGVEGAAVAPLFDSGLWLHAGAFLVPERWEVFVRQSRVIGDSGTLGRNVESADEIAVGSALYFHGEAAKLVFDATHVNGSPLNSSTLNLDAGDVGWLYRLQLQVGF